MDENTPEHDLIYVGKIIRVIGDREEAKKGLITFPPSRRGTDKICGTIGSGSRKLIAIDEARVFWGQEICEGFLLDSLETYD